MTQKNHHLAKTSEHCNTLQHTATHCNTLCEFETQLYADVGRSVTQKKIHHLSKTSEHCNTLQHTATHCNTLQHNATHFVQLKHNYMPMYAAPNSKKNPSIVQNVRALQHTATHCNTMQHTLCSWNTIICRCMPHQTQKKIHQLSKTSEHCNTLQHTLQHTATHFVQLRVCSLLYTCIHFITSTHLITHVSISLR